jgi:hypothetical protein
MPHVGQAAGKRPSGRERGNITYEGSQHPYRTRSEQGKVDPH